MRGDGGGFADSGRVDDDTANAGANVGNCGWAADDDDRGDEAVDMPSSSSSRKFSPPPSIPLRSTKYCGGM